MKCNGKHKRHSPSVVKKVSRVGDDVCDESGDGAAPICEPRWRGDVAVQRLSNKLQRAARARPRRGSPTGGGRREGTAQLVELVGAVLLSRT